MKTGLYFVVDWQGVVAMRVSEGPSVTIDSYRCFSESCFIQCTLPHDSETSLCIVPSAVIVCPKHSSCLIVLLSAATGLRNDVSYDSLTICYLNLISFFTSI